MEITLAELLVLMDSLGKLMKVEVDIPIKASWELAKIARMVSDKAAPAIQVRGQLVKKYGTKKDGNVIGVAPGSDNWPKFISELDDLLKQTVTIEINKVKLPSTIAVKPGALLGLEGILEIAD